MSDLTAKFTELEAQLAMQAATMGGYVDTVETKLQSILDNLDTIIVNNAANTRSILEALAQSSSCATCPTPPLSSVPPSETTTTADDEFCQRVQAFLTFISYCCDYADATGTVQSAFTTGFITSIIDQIRVDMDDSGIPYPGWIDTTILAADGVNFVINRALLGGGAHDSFDPVRNDIQAAMWAANSPAAAQSAYNDGIDATTGLAASRPLLKGFAYGDVVNYFLDPASTPNLTPYDGELCGDPSGCVNINSSLTTYPGSATGQAIWWVGDFNGSNCTPASYCADGPAWLDQNLNGWTLTMHGEADVFQRWNFSSTHLTDGQSLVLPDTDFMTVQNYPSTTPFSITLCPPEL